MGQDCGKWGVGAGEHVGAYGLDLLNQIPLVHVGWLLVLDHDSAVDENRVHAPAIGIVYQAVDRVEQGAPLRAAGVEQDDVGLLAGLDGANVRLQTQGPGAVDCGHLQSLLRRYHAGRARPSLYRTAAKYIDRKTSATQELFAESVPKPTVTPLSIISGKRPREEVPAPIFTAAVGHITILVSVLATQSTSESLRPTTWASRRLGPRTPMSSSHSMGRLP